MLHQFQNFHVSLPKDLTEVLADTLKNVERLSSEVKSIEKEIAEFNRYYYAEIGTLFEELQKLKTPKKVAEQTVKARAPRTVPKIESASVMAQKIYRRLAKHSHPDTQSNKVRNDFFIELNEAYQQKDLHKLMMLEQEWMQKGQAMPETKFDAMRRVEAWLDSACAAREYLEERRETLSQSPAYVLRQKIFWAKLSGEDLLGQIKHNMKIEIAELRGKFISV